MRHFACTILAGLFAVGCAQQATSVSAPSPVPAADLLLPGMVDDLPLAACVARSIATAAERTANRLQIREAGSRFAEMNARTRVEEADRARRRTAGAAMSASAAAASNPNDPSRQTSKSYARQAAGRALAHLRSSERRHVAAVRAAEALATSAPAAFTFARLAHDHHALFEHAARAEDHEPAADSAAPSAFEEGAIRSLREVVASDPDLEWLYVSRFLTAYDAPEPDCR